MNCVGISILQSICTMSEMTFAGLLTTNKETNKLRTFSRTFVTVPQGDGIVIANELYHITNASPEQQEVITCTIFTVDHCLVCRIDRINRQSLVSCDIHEHAVQIHDNSC
jgi:hypothetical protein